jgi:hypothetical protein
MPSEARLSQVTEAMTENGRVIQVLEEMITELTNRLSCVVLPDNSTVTPMKGEIGLPPEPVRVGLAESIIFSSNRIRVLTAQIESTLRRLEL